ncbi:hypothetical protein [Edwardsiella hoshinae]|nr:hypothetical protein [Edwardsiella hoshinae]
MKLRFLSMAVAMSVAGVANATPAWEEMSSGATKTFTASGTVFGKEASNKWQWAVGPGLPNLQGALSQAQASNGNKVTITIPQNTPILVGKTKEAFAVQLSGGVGAIPNIAFTDKGKPVKIIGGPAGYIDVDVYNSSDSKIGSAKLNLTAAAIASQKYSDPKKSVDLYSIFADLPGKIFYGGLSPNAEATYLSGRDALDVVTIFGGLSLDDVKSQLGVNSISVITTRRINEDMAYGIGDKVSASYALGFKAGQTIDVTFDANNKPTSTTQWTASLGIQVTYV